MSSSSTSPTPYFAPSPVRPNVAPLLQTDADAHADATAPASPKPSSVASMSPASSVGRVPSTSPSTQSLSASRTASRLTPQCRDMATQTDDTASTFAAAALQRPVQTTRLGRVNAWVCSDKAVAVAFGVATGAALCLAAPAAWPTASLAYNRTIVGALAAGSAAGAAWFVPHLPYRMLGAAFAGLMGAALAIVCAPCMMPSYLALVALVSAGFGYKASQHTQAITLALTTTAVLGAVWWAAGIVGPKFGMAVPQARFTL